MTWLESLKQNAEKATPGPWDKSAGSDVIQTSHLTRDVWTICHLGQSLLDCHDPWNDQAYIASASPDRILALIEALRVARDGLKRLTDASEALADILTDDYCEGPIANEFEQARLDGDDTLAEMDKLLGESADER